MRTFLFIILSLLFTYSKGQGVIADPAVSQIKAESTANITLDAAGLLLGNVIKLNIPVYNKNLLNSIPNGSCKIKIGLGTKMVLDPQFSLNSLPSSNYFNWTIDTTGQVQITGDLKNDLPANFSDSIVLMVKGSIQGNSTVTTNFQVTNHNTPIVLSDQNPTNNNSFLAYSIVASSTLPVTFTGLNAVSKDCNIDVDFFTATEINVNKYEIEASRNGTNFIKVGEIAASLLSSYKYSFAITDAFKAPEIFVRIKSLDKDGTSHYSGTKPVKTQCTTLWSIIAFPNPAKSVSRITVTARQGRFNGRYDIILSDMAGKSLIVKEVNLLNAYQFDFETGNIAAGQYIIRISQHNNGGETAVIKWQKY